MKILFLGSGAFGLPTLKTLIQAGHDLAMVVTQPDKPAGRGRHSTPTPIAAYAAEIGLPVLKTANLNGLEVIAGLQPLTPEILVVIAFGQKIADNVLRLASQGGINLHASLLPAFRGAAPIQRAILSGDHTTGVSVIRVTNIMDGGEILGQIPTPIGDSETAGELHDRLAELGAPLMQQVIEQVQSESVRAAIQDSTRISQAPKLSKDLAHVDFSQSARLVSCRIRGLSPWPGCLADLLTPGGDIRAKVTLLKCREVPMADHCGEPGDVLPELHIACGTGAIEILTLQPIGKRAMNMRSLANGYGVKPGWRLLSHPQQPEGVA
ncbi:MAG: methionyl-tRNA formyltransferase [Phycisphaerae bacterium]